MSEPFVGALVAPIPPQFPLVVGQLDDAHPQRVKQRQARQIVLDGRRVLPPQVGIILGWQNASPIENDLARLALFYALGVRVIQLTYNERKLRGNGGYERTDEGLRHLDGKSVG